MHIDSSDARLDCANAARRLWVENSFPQLVEGKGDLAAAVSQDGAGINISRAIGQAFAGLVIRYWQCGVPQSARCEAVAEN